MEAVFLPAIGLLEFFILEMNNYRRLSELSEAGYSLGFGLMPFSSRPAAVTGVDGVSRFSRVECPCMPGVSDCAESATGSR